MVPTYLLPTLGGVRSIRGFDSFRFRDVNALLLNAEYRWQVWLRLDLALFVDAGQVFEDFEELSAGEMAYGYGLGFRFMGAEERALARFDIARSREGYALIVTIGSIF